VRPVNTSQETDETDDRPTKVLGSLLDDGGVPVPETEWAEIVGAIRRGDQRALRDLYDRTHRIAFTLILRILKTPLTAEEVTLDVYHDVWQHAAAYDPARGSVVGWIMNQARSRAIDRLRREQRSKRVNDGKLNSDSDSDRQAPTESTPLEQQRQMLESALESLTSDERRAIEAAYFEESTYAEVAERLQTPLGTIKTRIRSGLAKLRTLLPRREDV
jgi:RNA polymerase sigma-70 factor, ECF subfamily